MFGSLMRSRRFAPIFWCQFFAAFNDNFLRNALVILVVFRLGTAGGEILATLSGAILIAPFFILSGLGGQLADRFDKAIIARRLKFTEIGAAAVAVVGFALQSVPLLFVALVLFGWRVRNCPPAMRWSKRLLSLPSCSAPSSAASRRVAAAARPCS